MSTSVTCILITFLDRQKQGNEAGVMSGRLQRFRLAQHVAAQDSDFGSQIRELCWI
jgi:hypothetical protein